MKSNKDFLGGGWISLFCGSCGGPWLGAPFGRVLVLGGVMVTSCGVEVVC